MQERTVIGYEHASLDYREGLGCRPGQWRAILPWVWLAEGTTIITVDQGRRLPAIMSTGCGGPFAYVPV